MAFTLTAGYTFVDGEVVTATKLGQLSVPTLASDQTYTFGAGTAAAPSWNFTGYTTTGLYAAAPGIGFTVAGASVGTWTATTFTVTRNIASSYAGQSTFGNSNTDQSVKIFGGTDATNAQLQLFGGSHATLAKQAFLDADTISLRTAAGTANATLSSSGLVMGTGVPIYLGNAYVATPQTCTGTVTIKDSSGTTYKVLVST